MLSAVKITIFIWKLQTLFIKIQLKNHLCIKWLHIVSNWWRLGFGGSETAAPTHRN